MFGAVNVPTGPISSTRPPPRSEPWQSCAVQPPSELPRCLPRAMTSASVDRVTASGGTSYTLSTAAS